MTTFIFPGQGSQAIGMGKDLFPMFPELIAQADEILGYSIMQLCLEDPQKQLNQTQFTQPALFVVSALSYLKKIQDGAAKPNYVAGHSLGEYNALFAANVFSFATGLQLVKKRGALMREALNGGMAAVVGLPADNISEVLRQNALTTINIANYNSYTQLVVSGPKADIDKAIPLFERSGAKMVIPLNVSGAFHSPYMQTAQQQFAMFLNDFEFHAPQIPVIANINARPYQTSDNKNNLAQQMTHSVQWVETIEYLLAQGETEFEEVGPGMVLTGLVRRIRTKQ